MINFYPGFIDNTDFRYINVDGKYISTLYIKAFPKKMFFLDFINNMPKNIQFDMSVFVQKQDTLKVLKDITYNISNSKAETNTINNNQIDIDVIDKLTDDAKKLRYQIQINNEQVYNIYTFITLRNYNKNELLHMLRTFRSILYSKMFVTNILNFRHLEGYIATLPINNLNDSISKNNYINMTTSNVVNMFPFYTNSIFDKNGIIFGYTLKNRNICSIDVFNSKYTNSNICVFGSSGAGKSYFVKLLILRHYITDINQYVFDPEGEYVNIAQQVGGTYISFNNEFNNFLNILDIDEVDLYESNFLYKKIDFVFEFLNQIINIPNEISENVKNAIKMSYIKKGINEDASSMYLTSDEDKVYVNKKIKEKALMPTLQDIYDNIKSDSDNKKIYSTFIKEFKDFLIKYEFLNKNTTIDLNNSLIIFSLNKMNIKIKDAIFNFLLNYIIKKISYKKNKTLIYIDEVWQFISNNIYSAEKIFMLYKTIRKLNAGIITITQDISDFFNKDFGGYGKSIINNSFMKIFFKMEHSDFEIFNKSGIISSYGLNEITKLNKGNVLIMFQNNLVNLLVTSNEFEDKLIKGENN